MGLDWMKPMSWFVTFFFRNEGRCVPESEAFLERDFGSPEMKYNRVYFVCKGEDITSGQINKVMEVGGRIWILCGEPTGGTLKKTAYPVINNPGNKTIVAGVVPLRKMVTDGSTDAEG